MIKKLGLSLFFSFFSLAIWAQHWLTDIQEAKALATEKNCIIILVFQGSDWCAPCMKLEKEIWSTEEFKTFADSVVLLKADFPRKKQNQLNPVQQKKNDQLAEKYNEDGYFPLVVVLNKSGQVLGTTGYQKMTPQEYISLLSAFEYHKS